MHHPTALRVTAAGLLPLFLLGIAGCNRGSDGTSNSGSTASSSSKAAALIDPSRCHNTTTGVTSDTITFGLSHPESGPSAATGRIADGTQAYFNYLNAEKGGVKGHQLKLIKKDDSFAPARTVANVNQMIEQDKVFGFVGNLGTPNNLAIWDRLDQQCIPNLLVVNGAPALVDPKGHPFTLIANAAYATEVTQFVNYLKKNKPDAKIALLYENDDFGKSYEVPLQKAVQGTSLKLVSEKSYQVTDPSVATQMTAIGASGADTLFIGAQGLKCPQAIDAAKGLGITTTYLTVNCTSKAIIGLAKPEAAEGIISESGSMDPGNAKWASNARMQDYLTNAKKYGGPIDPTNSSIAYGWNIGVVLADILNASPKLDRVSVMNTARSLTIKSPGTYLDGVTWQTDGAKDPYPIEAFTLQKYDSTKHLFEQMGPLLTFEGQTQKSVG
jgi:branched-chain amino acid transport system substrate-binding protein